MKKKYEEELKQMSTKDLAMLLSSGICGDEYKDALVEYTTRHDKPNIKPGRKIKNRKARPKIDYKNITYKEIKQLNLKELKTLMACGLTAKKRKVIYTEYLNRVYLLRDIKRSVLWKSIQHGIDNA